MKLPTGSQLVTEAAIVIGGAVLAALVVSQLPGLASWINAQWRRPAAAPCDCNR